MTVIGLREAYPAVPVHVVGVVLGPSLSCEDELTTSWLNQALGTTPKPKLFRTVSGTKPVPR